MSLICCTAGTTFEDLLCAVVSKLASGILK